MLTVKAYFENGEIKLPESVKGREAGPVLVTFLDRKELEERSGIMEFVEGTQRNLDSTVIPRKQFETHQEEKAQRNLDTQKIFRDQK